jgi:hypothetical protein
MDKTQHVFISGLGAEEFADSLGHNLVERV